MELFLGIVVAIATLIGAVGGLILQHQGNKHFEEQNRIMIEQGGGKTSQVKVYKPPYWPLITMAVLVLLCWGSAVYDHHLRKVEPKPVDWAHYEFKRIEHQQFVNETVTLDGNEFVDVSFENVTFMYHGTAPMNFISTTFVPATTGKLQARLGSDNPVVMQTLMIANAMQHAGGCPNGSVVSAPDLQ
jgi:hypothetical protein